MAAILKSIYCIPCIWSIIILLGTFGVVSYVLNIWCPYRGPLPSDGPIDGFASKTDRMDFFDTGPQRIRIATYLGGAGGFLWLLGLLIAIIVLKSVA
jgi:hypothetical protein